MIESRRPLAVIFTVMAAVIILYRLYVGTSDDFISVDSALHAAGTVGSVDNSGDSYTVTLEDVEIFQGTYIGPDKKLLLYIKSGSQVIRNFYVLSDENPHGRNRETGKKSIRNEDTAVNDLQIGNTIEVRGTAEAFGKAGNPGQFNARSYYLGKGYAYRAFVESCTILDGSVSYREYLRRIGDYCTGIFERYLPQNEAGIISAMMFGKKNLLSEEDRELYKVNGLMHILAVSGMHIEAVSLIFLFIITKLPVSFRTGRIFLFIMLILYGIITGFGVSCIRAVIMCGLKIMAQLVGRTYDVISSLSFAAIITLLINPANLFRCDFLLSYLAVTAIAVVYPAMERGVGMGKTGDGLIYNIIVKPLLFGVCVNITTLPVILYFYYDAALYSILTGLIILPLISVLFVTGCLCAAVGGIFPPAGMFFAGGIHFILSFYRVICEWCVDTVYGMRITGCPGICRMTACYVVIALLVCAARFIQNRRACVFLCAALVIIPVCILGYKRSEGLKITVLDVGQGDGIVICTPDGKVICVDGGSTDVEGLAKYRIEPYLFHEGIRRIDYWIVTHIDNDHYSGLREILGRRRYNGIVIDKIVVADTEICRGEFFNVFSDYDFNSSPAILYMDNRDSIAFGDAALRCLSPVSSCPPGYSPSCQYENQNESSIVFELSYGGFEALFTGDIEGGHEERLPVDNGKRYELLKVAHHGSKNSTSDIFLGKLLCDNAVISYGRENRYGHPHQETLERLRMHGIRVYETAGSGAVTVIVDEDGYRIAEYLVPIK